MILTEQDFYDLPFHEVDLPKMIDKWEGLGFLENSCNKKNDALAFMYLATWLLEGYKRYDQELETILFPVIHRIVRQYKEDIPIYVIKSLVLELADTFPINIIKGLRKISQEPGEEKIDHVARFLSDYCDNYPPFMF